MKIDKKELSNILGVKVSGVTTIEKRNKLHIRLEKLGYKFVKKIKEGRNVFYILDKVEEYAELHSKVITNVYNTNLVAEFSEFFVMRCEGAREGVIASNKDISEVIEVSNNTVCKWNKILLDKKIISKEGFYYFSIENTDGVVKCRQTTKEEYSSYWKSKRDEAIYSELEYRFNKEEISFRDAMKLVKEIGHIQAATEGKYVYRIHKYQLNQENKLYIDTYDIIKKAMQDKFKKIDFKKIDQLHEQEKISNETNQ